MSASGLNPKNKIPGGDTKGGFILFRNTNNAVAYNINDAGNFLWGQAMSRIGITLTVAKLAAHANSIKVGDGPDSYSDQAALTRGWSLNVKTSQSVMHKIFMAKPFQINAQGKNKGW